ncbi:hypothetical protein FG386_001400 [Cryptosporidium ryanae]|uniref:uncharacterized protein n=1 Tax=Cryptosporidium ryanae TaxID=515981 RepID=UPI003519FD8E|nr:hypothetical protein FG386_001400 [Cryptosporidium ryanae]
MKGSILFLGSGSILGTPSLEHVLRNIRNSNNNIKEPHCKICNETINISSKNKRNPFSLIIKNPLSSDKSDEKSYQDYFLFEMGPNFRISMLEYAVPMNIKKIDCIFLLSSNEKSFLGIDEVREVQLFEKNFDNEGTLFYHPKKRIPTYLTSSCLISLNDWYKYIIDYSLKEDLNSKTKVGCIQLNILDPEKSFNVIQINSIEEYNSYLHYLHENKGKNKVIQDLSFHPITIEYSQNIKITVLFLLDSKELICSAYVIEYINFSEKKVICILPEYSIIPETTMNYLKNIEHINFLILPIFFGKAKKINQETLAEITSFCKVMNCNQFYFYNTNCLYDHDFLQSMVDEYCINNNIDLRFTISYDSLNIPIY